MEKKNIIYPSEEVFYRDYAHFFKQIGKKDTWRYMRPLRANCRRILRKTPYRPADCIASTVLWMYNDWKELDIGYLTGKEFNNIKNELKLYIKQNRSKFV